MVSSRLILAAAVLTLAIFAGIIHAQEKWVGNIYIYIILYEFLRSMTKWYVFVVKD